MFRALSRISPLHRFGQHQIYRLCNNLNWRYFAFIFINLILAWLVFDHVQYSNHPDNPITHNVVKGMVESNSLRNSWHNYDVPEVFRYGQTNFAGYHTSLAVIFDVFGIDPNNAENFHAANFVIAGLALALIVAYTLIKLGPSLGAFLICAATIINFQIFQDTHYFRAENFVGLWVVILTISIFERPLFFQIWIPISFGILLATKFSFALLGSFIFLILLAQKRPLRFYLAASILGCLVITLFNQSIILETESFVNGINYLINHYGGAHLPHGLPNASILERLLYALNYQFVSNFFFIGLAVLGFLSRDRSQQIFATMALFLIVYFSTKAVFFERNISFLNFATPIFVVLLIKHLSPNWQNLAKIWLGLSIVASAFNIMVFSEVLDVRRHTYIPPTSGENVKPVIVGGWAFSTEGITQKLRVGAYSSLRFFDSGHPDFWAGITALDNVAIDGKVDSRMWYFPSSTVHTQHHMGSVYVSLKYPKPYKCKHMEICGLGNNKDTSVGALVLEDTIKGGHAQFASAPGKCIAGTYKLPEGDRAVGKIRLQLLSDSGGIHIDRGPTTKGIYLYFEVNDEKIMIPESTNEGWTWLDLEKVLPKNASKPILIIEDHGDYWGAWGAVAWNCSE